LTRSDQSPPIRTQWLVDTANERGISVAQMKLFLQGEGNEEPSWAALPMNSYIALFNWVAQHCGDPHLGLHLAKDVGLSTFGGSAYMIYHASSLGDCCQCLARYDQTISQGILVTYFPGLRDSRLEYQAIQPAGVDVSHDSEMSAGMLVYFFRQHLGERWTPKKVHFSHPAPQQLDDHHALFGSNLLFDQASNCVWFDNRDLNTKVTKADPYLLEVLRGHTDELQEKILRRDSVLAQVKYFIARTIGSEECTAVDAAGQLYMSRRTLTRQLSNQGTSFRDLRNEITESMAKKALTETSVNVGEIALSLGYAESSAFDRAFKLSTGCTPTAYRQQASVKNN